jgi:hypothetical protein
VSSQNTSLIEIRQECNFIDGFRSQSYQYMEILELFSDFVSYLFVVVITESRNFPVVHESRLHVMHVMVPLELPMDKTHSPCYPLLHEFGWQGSFKEPCDTIMATRVKNQI